MDIGANIGWFTLLAARVVGDTGKVFGLSVALQDINEEERHTTPTTAAALMAEYGDGQGRHTSILCTPSGG